MKPMTNEEAFQLVRKAFAEPEPAHYREGEIRKLIQRLRIPQEVGVDMSLWIYRDAMTCHTAGCAAGHYLLMRGFTEEQIIMMDDGYGFEEARQEDPSSVLHPGTVAGRLMGLKADQQASLFRKGCWSDHFRDRYDAEPDNRQAVLADMLEDFLSEGRT